MSKSESGRTEMDGESKLGRYPARSSIGLLSRSVTRSSSGSDWVAEHLSPYFPRHSFALVTLAHTAREIRYATGVNKIVRFGQQAAVEAR